MRARLRKLQQDGFAVKPGESAKRGCRKTVKVLESSRNDRPYRQIEIANMCQVKSATQFA